MANPPEDQGRSWIPAAMAGTVGAAPLATLALQKKSPHDFSKAPMYTSADELAQHMQVGDVLLAGDKPSITEPVSGGAAYASGSPFWHGEAVVDVDGQGPRTLYGSQSPGLSPAEARNTARAPAAGGYSDAVLLRPKKGVDPEKFRQAMLEQAGREYDVMKGVPTYAADMFVPDFVPRPDLDCSSGFCTSGVAQALEDSGVGRVNPRKGNHATMAHDFLRSDLFEPVASASAEDGFLRSNPTGELSKMKRLPSRLAAGGALAAGTYAALNNPLAAAAGGVGVPLALAAGTAGMRRFAPGAAARIGKGLSTLERKVLGDARSDALDFALDSTTSVGGLTLRDAPALATSSYLGGTAAGALSPESSLWHKEAMDLQFATPQQAQQHTNTRTLAGGVGGMLGAAGGAALGNRVGGVKGLLLGGALGLGTGVMAGRVGADVAHDAPQRAGQAYHRSMHHMEQAGGSGVRIAAALPSLTEFLEFAQEHGEREEQGETARGPATTLPLDGTPDVRDGAARGANATTYEDTSV